MKTIEGDIKHLTDELNECKLNLAVYGKKEGNSFYGKDLGEEIYEQAGEAYFRQCKTSEVLSTFVCIVHRQKLPAFTQQYEFWPEGSVVPESMKVLEKTDGEDNLLIGVTVLTSAVDEFHSKARAAGFTVKRFQYNLEKFKED